MKFSKTLLLLCLFLILLVGIIIWKSIKNENYIEVKNTHNFQDKYAYQSIEDQIIDGEYVEKPTEYRSRNYAIQKEKEQQKSYLIDDTEIYLE
jgi:hypothetical protein